MAVRRGSAIGDECRILRESPARYTDIMTTTIINIFNFTCVESEACDPLQEDGKDGLGVGNNGDA